MVKRLAAFMAALLLTLLPMSGIVSAATLSGNPIANPTITGAGTLDPDTNVISPSSWKAQSWTSVPGAITPSFQYVTNDGHGDSSSVKVTMTNYEKTYVPGAEDGTQGGAMTGDDGDAKWVFDALPVGAGNALQVGGQYRFTSWFKGNVTPKIVADYIQADGTESFFGMPNPLTTSETTWTQYSDTFTIPQGTTAVTIFMFLDQNGWIQTDDYSITDYTPTGFSEPLLSLTFDDGHEDNVNNLLPLLTEYGYKTTQCFETGTLKADPAQAQTNVMAFQQAGHEICSHTITHPMLTQVNDTQLTKELNESKSYLENLLKTNGSTQTVVPDFASPYGDYNAHVNEAIKAAGYTSHRTVDEGFNSKENFDPFRIRVQNIFYDSPSTKTTTAAQIAAWVQQAKDTNTWLVLVYHRVVDTTKAGQAGYEAPGPYDTSKDVMKQHLDAIKASGIKVSTMADALTEVKAQVGGSDPGTPVDTTAPVVSDVVEVEGGAESGGGFQISWKTNETAVCTIEYGLTNAYGTTISVPAAPFTPNMFVQNLYGLNADATYFYKITATDASGNASTYTGDFKTSANYIPGALGDLDKDGDVDGLDLSTLLGNWRTADPSTTPLLGDLDGNGLVNGLDLSTLLGNWSKK